MVNRMNDLLELILKELKKIHQRVYYEDAEDEAIFPYIIFYISVGTNTEERHDDTLVIEVWDENQDTTKLEDIVDEIEKHFDYECFNTDKLSTVAYKESRSRSEKEKKEDLSCREIRFELQTYYC